MQQDKRIELFAQLTADEPNQELEQLLCAQHADVVSSLVSTPNGLELQRLADRQQRLVLMSKNPVAHPECCAYDQAIWCGNGMEQLARLRDDWPNLKWVPRIEVEKQTLRYSFPRNHDEATFKCYMLDSTSVNAFVVSAERDEQIGKVLERANELGFNGLWIHSPDAEKRAKGLPLELLEKVRSQWQEELWLSGGVAETRHLSNLVEQGGADAVVLPLGWLLEQPLEPLQNILMSSDPEIVEVQPEVEVGLPQRNSV